MKVLDASFLIDYLNGVPSTEQFYEAEGSHDERWIMPVPAYAEVLVGVGSAPDADVADAVEKLAWGEVYGVDEKTAITAAEIADEIGPGGPYLDGMDALIAAVSRELDAPVVSADGDLTHPETKRVIDVNEY
jgi:predicted nucleic acid-binding protein